MLDWLLSNTAIGLATWIGTAVGLAGLYIIYLQARAARTAAEAATRAVQQLEGRLNIANFAYANAQLGVVRMLIDRENFEAAAGVFGMIRRMILQSCDLVVMQDGVAETVALVKRNVRTLEMQLIHALHEPERFRAITASRALAGVSTALTALEGQATFRRQE